MRSFGNAAGVAIVAVLIATAALQAQANVQAIYKDALSREAAIRKDLDSARPEVLPDALLTRLRTLVGAFEDLARLFPTSESSDDALWHGGQLSADAFWKFGAERDRTTALRLLEVLRVRYPVSSLTKQLPPHLTKLAQAQARATAPAAPTASAIAPTETRVAPTTKPIAPTSTTVAPTSGGVAPTAKPIAPSASPVAPAPGAVAPTPKPVAPTESTTASTGTPVAPAESRVAPTPKPVAPTESTTASTGRPVAPTESSITPTTKPLTPTASAGAPPGKPVAPTAIGVAPTANPIAPTASTVAPTSAAGSSVAGGIVTLKSIRREPSRDVLRVTLELDGEVFFHHERIEGPPRVFIDLESTRTVDTLRDATLPYTDDVVRQIRVGRHAAARTRVVLDLRDAGRYSVYPLYNPYRLVFDFERATAAPPAPAVTRAAPAARPVPRPPALPPASASVAPSVSSVPPSVPSVNGSGGFSLSRQLGLGISRIVIDPGHGGRDPGAKGRDLSEAELVLDIARRLEKLLVTEGVEVVLTRTRDDYVSLEERTALANRAGADLFLSIHANASSIATARGVETYFLNFAQNSAAEALAARENAGSTQGMRNLPDIVKAIALNDKIDESRDFATSVQAVLYDRLRRIDRNIKNLGVKQAPFMVLIGATMPSVLVEIAFLTHRQEATLLKTERYRQQVADALFAGITRYQQLLKKTPAVAAR